MTDVHAPPNKLLRIDEVYLFVSVDQHGEGVCAAPLPLIAADKERLASIIPVARMLAKRSGRKIKLIKFTMREELMEITPEDGSMQ